VTPGEPFRHALGVAAALLVALCAEPVRADDAPPPEVEVRGAPVSPAAAPKDPSVAASTLRRDELKGPGRSAADALRGEVGLSVAETGGLGAAATASVRGATAAETPVYLAGVRINDDVAGAADLSTLPLWLIDRVEVYRGNAPLEADRFGIGGAIFFEPIRPREALAGLGGLIGSYGSRALWAFAATGGKDHGLLVGARLEGADNDYSFVNDRGTLFDDGDDRVETLQNADATGLDLWALGHARVGGGATELVLNRFEREQGVPRLALVPTHASRQRTERTLAAVTGRAPLGPSSALDARTSLLVTGTTVDDPLYELSLRTDRIELLGERLEQHLGARADVLDVATLRVALDAGPERLRRYEGTGPSGDDAALDARRLSARLALHADIEVSPGISIRPLGALECQDTDTMTGLAGAPNPADSADSAGCDEVDPTGRLGALAVFGEFAAFAGAGRYVRVPTLGELYGMSVVVRGNPRLESETGTTFDAGARFTRRLDSEIAPLFAAASAYTRGASELVSFVRTAQGYVVPMNVGKARLNGLEIEAGAGFLRHFSAEAAMTALDARDRTPDRQRQNDILPYRPRLLVASGIRATTGATGFVWAEELTLSARHLYQASQYADLAGLAVIPEQHSLDLDVTVSALEGGIVLRARVANVFDSARYDVVGFPLPGRSFFASLEGRP
jgi:iron complex outermembrane receptor protein